MRRKQRIFKGSHYKVKQTNKRKRAVIMKASDIFPEFKYLYNAVTL